MGRSSKKAVGNRITQGPCNSGNNSQWKFIKFGTTYIIMNKSGQVLAVNRSGRNNGAHIYSSKRSNGSNQRFYYSFIGSGKFMLKNLNSKKCIDNTGKARRGVGYHQWNCSRNNKNQHFRIQRIRAQNLPPKGWVMIKGNGNLCVQGSAAKKAKKSWFGRSSKKAVGRRITQGSCNSGKNSQWKFIKFGTTYIIMNKSGQVLEVSKMSRNNGAHIYASNRSNKSNQRFYYSFIGSGKFM